ncbi:MAG TPA: AI-2E family transporter [Aggregatilineales bacterium]|nr:AI-2E family transporter [Aggregatilineales bacterium]
MSVTVDKEKNEVRAEIAGYKIQFSLNPRLWLAVVGAGVLTWLIIRYGALIAEVVIVLFAAFLLSLALRPLADRLVRYRIPRGVTVIAVYVAVIALFYLLIQLTIPAIAREIATLQEGGTEIMVELVNRLENLPPFSALNINLETLFETIATRAEAAAGVILTALADVTRVVVDLLLILVLAYFFVVDQKLGINLLFTWVPRHHRWKVRTVARNTSRRLTRWIVAQVALAATFGLIFGIGLLLMGVPFAVSIAIIGAILEFVPFLGGFISLTLSILVSLTFRPEMTIWVVVLYFAIQQLQLNVLQPVLFGHAVDVHPAIVLIGLLIGAQLGGVIGALFAIPIAVVIITVLDEIEKPGDMLPPPDDASQSPDRLPG